MLSFIRRNGNQRSSLAKESADLSVAVENNKKKTSTFHRAHTMVLAMDSSKSDWYCDSTADFVPTSSSSFGDLKTHDKADSGSFGDLGTNDKADSKELLSQRNKIPTLLAPREFPDMDCHGSSFGSFDSSSSFDFNCETNLDQFEKKIHFNCKD